MCTRRHILQENQKLVTYNITNSEFTEREPISEHMPVKTRTLACPY